MAKNAKKIEKNASLNIDTSDVKISKRTKNKVKRLASNTSGKTWAFAFLCLVVGALIGIGAFYFVSRNDCFEIVGQDELTFTLEEKFTDPGVKIISIGKDYSKDAKVYILVPSNDFSKTKRIIGTVNNLATDYVSVVAGTEESYDKVGTDIIDDNGEYGIISGLSWDRERNFITLYDAGKSDNIISVNENVAKEYMSKCEYFIMAANFRTALIESQKFNGTYSYKITIQFKDKASGEDKYRDYILSSLEMTGQPYNFLSKTRQFKVCRYEGLEYVKISKVMFLCSNFLQTSS